jgi:hypothetical protein
MYSLSEGSKTPAMEDSSSWKLPANVRIKDDQIFYSLSGPLVSDAATALEAFIELGDKSERDISRFVKQFSALHLHSILIADDWPFGGYSKIKGVNAGQTWSDQLQFYKILPKAFYAAREIHGYVCNGDRAPDKLWANLYQWPLMWRNGFGERVIDCAFWHRELDAFLLAEQVNAWLAESQVRPSLEVKSGARFGAIQFNVGTLYGALVTQLLKEVSGLSEWVLCSNSKCRKSYIPELRRPKSGQRHFCPSCRKAGVPKKIADRESKARKAAKREEPVSA